MSTLTIFLYNKKYSKMIEIAYLASPYTYSQCQLCWREIRIWCHVTDANLSNVNANFYTWRWR
jgi:hypothetical protein